MTRVLLLAPGMTQLGGVERMVAGLAGLLGRRHEVAVASFDPPGARPAFALPCPFHPLGDGRLPRPLAYLDQARRLRALERRLGTQVTISNLWRADLVSALAGRHARRVALAHINIVGNPTNAAMLRLRPLVAAIYRRLDRVVAVSAALERELAALYRLPSGRSAAIPNFVAPPAPPAAPRDANRLVWCGRMVAEKNAAALPAILVRLRARLPAVTLELIGDGPERAAIAACAQAEGVSVTFHGALADPYPLIATAAALLLPSRAEGLPMVVLEALALGTPVIAADAPAGGVGEALGRATPHDPRRPAPERTDAGLLLPIPESAADAQLWADAIAALLANPPALARLSTGARARAAAYAPDVVAGRWESLLAGLAM